MVHNNTALMAINPFRINPTTFQKTMAVNDFYFRGDEGYRFPLGNLQLLGKLYEDPARRAAREAGTLLKRLAEPEDIAGVALMLAARAGSYITGQTIVVDGGTTIAP